MKINPYITYKDNCREAFEFYAEVLGGEVEFVQTFGEAPGAVAPLRILPTRRCTHG